MRRVFLLLLAACAPDLTPPEFLVDRPRVLAIKATPADRTLLRQLLRFILCLL